MHERGTLRSVVGAAAFCLAFGCLLASCASTDEPTAEAQEALPIVSYNAADFPFVTVVEDNGRGKAGGWQAASASLDFKEWVLPYPPRTWTCSLTIGMPLRAEYMGRITPVHAAAMSVEIATEVARGMDFKLPPGIFCEYFVNEMGVAFRARYPLLGSRVTKR